MKDLFATVVSSRPVAAEIVEMELAMEGEIDPAPGQFAHIAVKGAFLRRPISVAGYDASHGVLRLAVQRVGRGTRTLTEMEEGERVKLLAPLGNPFPLEHSTAENGRIWLVGGGIGVAPLLYLAKKLFETRNPSSTIRSFVGFRSDELVFGTDELERYGRIDLSVGGFVTDLLLEALENERPSVIYACGPEPLLRNLQKICNEKDLKVYASLEEHMGCGIGACLVCSCKVRTQSDYEYKRVCYDGPVFDLSEVIFG